MCCLLLPNIAARVAAQNTTHMSSHSFPGSGIQAQLSQVPCLGLSLELRWWLGCVLIRRLARGGQLPNPLRLLAEFIFLLL